jgi:hypothetical protein
MVRSPKGGTGGPGCYARVDPAGTNYNCITANDRL